MNPPFRIFFRATFHEKALGASRANFLLYKNKNTDKNIDENKDKNTDANTDKHKHESKDKHK